MAVLDLVTLGLTAARTAAAPAGFRLGVGGELFFVKVLRSSPLARFGLAAAAVFVGLLLVGEIGVGVVVGPRVRRARPIGVVFVDVFLGFVG